MVLNIQRYILVEKIRVYVRILGEGPPIVLLHPSPHSSEMLMPLAKQLAKWYTVICLDTPGYGRSDVLECPPDDLAGYVQILHTVFCALNIEKMALYGSATGAQMAIRYALQYPNRISHVFLDNAAHFEDDFREEILQHYFPDLTPQTDGGHLDALWTMVTHMFQYFPWCFREAKFALNKPPVSLKVLQTVAMDFLKTGANYDLAYRAAFVHEHARHVQQLLPKTTIFRWEGSIILPYIDALLSFDLPSHIQQITIPENATARMEKMVEYMGEKALGMPSFFLAEDVGVAVGEAKSTSTMCNCVLERPPELASDGSHLRRAWKKLRNCYPDMEAVELQTELVNWFMRFV